MASPKTYKRAIILGAAGFIGINLANSLDEQGYELICFDRKPSPQWPEGTQAIIGDFANLPVELLEALDNALVFHLVSSCRPSPSTAQVAEEINLDLISTLRYLEATKTRNLRWVFLSSGGTVYGQQESDCIAETNPTAPICSYGLVKVTIEKYFALYRTLHNVDYVIARLANPYGPWQDPLRGQGIIAALIYKALKGETIEIWGDGSNVRDYIYIDDAIQGISATAILGKPGEIYNIGTAMGYSINQLIEIVSSVLGIELSIQYFKERPVDVQRNTLDIRKSSDQTNWSPKTDITSGISLTITWLEKKHSLAEKLRERT